MKRRELIKLFASLPAAWPLFTHGQQIGKVVRIGILSTVNPRTSPPFVAIEQGLREYGYIEGENLILEFRNARGRLDRLPELAAELVNLPVDIIAASGPEATLRAASQATRSIPIVTMAVNYDPVAKGYVDSLARPGGNITGVYFMQVTLSAKRLGLLKEVMPELSRVMALYDVYTADQLQETESAAQSLGLQLQSLELQNPPYDFDQALGVALSHGAQALVVLSSPVFYRQRAQLAEATLKYELPAMFQNRSYAEVGGLIAYGADIIDMYRYAASYVAKILQGANPADLPMEQPTKFDLVINLKGAKALGLTLPPSIILQATEVIE